jgi:type I restriction enzyme S subunit
MSDWKSIKVKDTGKVITGKTPSKKNPEYWGKEIPFVTPSDYSETKYIIHSERYLSVSGYQSLIRNVISPNSIMVTCIGSDMGKVAINKHQVVTNQQINSLILSDIYNSDFIYYKLKSIYRTLRIFADGGSTMPILNKSNFENLELTVPYFLKEQKSIAAILSALDSKIENLHKQNQTLEKIAQTLFKHWFVDFEFPDENGNPYKSSGGKMIDSELGPIPVEWKAGKLDDEFDIIMGQSPKGSSYNEDGNGLVFFQGRSDFGFRFPTIRLYTTEPKRIADINDVLVSVRAPVGDINVAYEKCCIGRGLSAVQSQYNSYCLYKIITLKKKFDLFEQEGSVFGSINKKDFNSIKVIIPSNKTIESYEKLVNPIDKKIINNEKDIRTLTKTRDTLLPKLMSGEIRVN